MQKISLQKPQTNFHVQEAIKTLRSNIDFSGEDIKAVCVTSALPGDGKSTISYELACSFAQSGRRVLLVDADMRKSVMRKFVAEGDAQYGLSHLLAGKAGLDDVMCQQEIPDADHHCEGEAGYGDRGYPSRGVGHRRRRGVQGLRWRGPGVKGWGGQLPPGAEGEIPTRHGRGQNPGLCAE